MLVSARLTFQVRRPVVGYRCGSDNAGENMKLNVRIALLALFATTTLWGQAVSTSQISGIVRDQTGAVIPGAQVKATETETGLVRIATTDSDGSYILNNLPVGPYELRVERDGFKTFVQTGIILQVATNPGINPVLEVGSTSTSIEVQAGAAMVETETNDVGQVVDDKSITELPLLNRQAINLIVLEGVANNTGGGDLNSNKNIPTVTFSVAGGLPNGIVYLLDGGTHNDPFNNLNLPLPFPDAMQEFKVETSAMPARYGEHAAASVNAVTKSGTNQFHGDAFEFIRNYLLNAKDYFQLTRDSLKQNQYGGVIGGPIRRDKLFFFAGYQATVTRSNPTSGATTFVPTAAMLTGDFTAYAAAGCNKSFTDPFNGTKGQILDLPNASGVYDGTNTSNKVNASQLSSVALNMFTFARSHLPVSTNPCGSVPLALPANTNERQILGRIDYIMSQRNTLYARYLIDDYRNPTATGAQAVNALLSAKTGQSNQDQSFTLGDTFIINSRTTSSSHATLIRDGNARFPSSFFSALDIGVNQNNFYSPPNVPFFTNISASPNGFGVGSSEPGNWNQTGFQFAEDIDMVRGSHEVSFGVDWIHSLMNSLSTAAANGNFSFGNSFTGLSLTDFLLGDLASFSQANAQQEDDRSNYIGLYAQDSWKVKPRLTLNYGLRWEPYFPQQNPIKHAENFDPGRFAAGTHSTVFPNAPAGLLFPGDPGFPANGDTFGRLAVFAPRVGLVWQPEADGKTTVRAAYGVFNDAPQMFFTVRFGSDAPWGPAVSFNIPTTAPGQFSNPWAAPTSGQPGGKTPFPGVSFFPVGANAAYVTEPLHMNPEYLQQWNLSIQRQVGSNLLLSATYVGNETTHLPTGRELDPGVYIAGNCLANGNFPAPYNTLPDGLTKNGLCTQSGNINFRRQLLLANPAQGTFFGTVGVVDDGGVANYNGLLLSAQRRLANNFSGFVNWTYSHCLSDPPTTELTGPTYFNPAARHADYGNCSSDRRQAVNIAFVASSPTFSISWKRRLLTGWQFSPIFRYQSGNFATVTLGRSTNNPPFGDQAGNGFGSQRPLQILADPYLANSSPNPVSPSPYFNYNAFTPPQAGVLPPASGVVRPFTLENPGSVQMDASLSRTFDIREAQKLQFRWDIFNLPNLVNLPGPATDLSSQTNFGTWKQTTASATGPRIMQLALKYIF